MFIFSIQIDFSKDITQKLDLNENQLPIFESANKNAHIYIGFKNSAKRTFVLK